MTGFNGHDLAALIAYERDALEFVRATLFNQTEATSHSLTLKLSEAKDEEGFYPRHIGLSVEPILIGSGAVQSALSRLRPLAFSAAFKVQDMIAEWVLHANGSRARTFKGKIIDYDAMKDARTLLEPLAFAYQPIVSKAFWELYRALTPLRNQIIHKNSFSLANDALTISTLRLSDAAQGAYIRAICLIADALVGGTHFEGVSAYIIENDLKSLSAIHNVNGLNAKEVRTASVTAVARGQMTAEGRIEANVDFDEIKLNAEGKFPPSSGGVLLFDLTLIVEADSRKPRWKFLPTAIPVGAKRVTENDPEFEPYREPDR